MWYNLTAASKTVCATLLFLSWVVFSSIALFYFGNEHYGQFDHSHNWTGSDTISISLSQLGIAVLPGAQVVHVKHDQCICNSRATQHIAMFSKEYQLPDSAQAYLTPKQLAAVGFYIPATPAVLIFRDGQLIYAGPYATGPLCAVSDSIIAPILANNLYLPGLWLNGEAKACRCVVNSTT